MAKKGRKSVYDTNIKPRFSEITQWLQNGATERQIADNLGVSLSSFYKWKSKKTEFAELIKNGRKSLVLQLRGAMVKKGLGFNYTETKKVRKTDEGGNVTEYEETVNRYSAPDVAALNLCLKNYDADEWANDPQALKLKREELDLKREMLSKDDW